MHPLVSVIIPLHNASRYVDEAIESIINQSYQNWELIIVDDGSTDNSLQIAKTYQTDRIKVYSIANRGAAYARNFGFNISKGEFIKFFDADDIVNAEMISDQINIVLDNPLSIISSKWGRFYNNELSTFKLNPEECWQDMRPIDWICSSWENGESMTQTGMFLIPRKLLLQYGLWNEKLSLIDDFEFFTRIILSSENVKFCQSAILYYRSGQNNSLSKTLSRKGIESELLAIQLATSELLANENSCRTKRVSALAFAKFVYGNYPAHEDLLNQAEAAISKLGTIDFIELLPVRYRFIGRIFTWKVIKYLIFIKAKLNLKLHSNLRK